MVSKAQLIRAAIKNYLCELKEDREDAEIALARKNDHSDNLLTSEEATGFFKKKYGL
jgi:ABC-type Zn uptake system ZnuABC Zn-binding protein ZnuA